MQGYIKIQISKVDNRYFHTRVIFRNSGKCHKTNFNPSAVTSVGFTKRRVPIHQGGRRMLGLFTL